MAKGEQAADNPDNLFFSRLDTGSGEKPVANPLPMTDLLSSLDINFEDDESAQEKPGRDPPLASQGHSPPETPDAQVKDAPPPPGGGAGGDASFVIPESLLAVTPDQQNVEGKTPKSSPASQGPTHARTTEQELKTPTVLMDPVPLVGPLKKREAAPGKLDQAARSKVSSPSPAGGDKSDDASFVIPESLLAVTPDQQNVEGKTSKRPPVGKGPTSTRTTEQELKTPTFLMDPVPLVGPLKNREAAPGKLGQTVRPKVSPSPPAGVDKSDDASFVIPESLLAVTPDQQNVEGKTPKSSPVGQGPTSASGPSRSPYEELKTPTVRMDPVPYSGALKDPEATNHPVTDALDGLAGSEGNSSSSNRRTPAKDSSPRRERDSRRAATPVPEAEEDSNATEPELEDDASDDLEVADLSQGYSSTTRRFPAKDSPPRRERATERVATPVPEAEDEVDSTEPELEDDASDDLEVADLSQGYSSTTRRFPAKDSPPRRERATERVATPVPETEEDSNATEPELEDDASGDQKVADLDQRRGPHATQLFPAKDYPPWQERKTRRAATPVPEAEDAVDSAEPELEDDTSDDLEVADLSQGYSSSTRRFPAKDSPPRRERDTEKVATPDSEAEEEFDATEPELEDEDSDDL
ncbi:MAG: hypothetical protein LBU79_10280, partial [Planctomycetota bacterium]|nr:hypothetical protein [Planctomycetota bacterium]